MTIKPNNISRLAVKIELLRRGALSFDSFCRDIIKVSPTPQQQELIDAYDAGEMRIAVRSGHGTGKSTVLGWFVVFYLLSWEDAIVPITSTAFERLRKTLWKEVAKAYRKLPTAAKCQLEKFATEIRRRDNPDESFAFIRTADDPDNFAGFHSEHMFIIVDEASGVGEDMFEVIEGAMSQDDNGLILTGNPTNLTGEFYNAFHKNRSLYHLLHWNGETSPLVTDRMVELLRKKYGGVSSNEYKIRVLGDFPDSEENALVSLADIEACIGNDSADNYGDLVYGVDVARQGDDSSVICKRKGGVVISIDDRHGYKNTQVAGWVEVERKIDNPAAIKVDVIGIGAGVVDILDENNAPVVPVNVAESPQHEPDRFRNLRAELYWTLKGMIERHEISLPDDDELVKELAAIKYDFTPTGLIRIEEKDKLKDKKRLGRSPDRADALMLSFFEADTSYNDFLKMSIGG
jgi:hypothetical protein